VVIVGACQRWRNRRGRYRPVGEVFDPRLYEVAEIEDDRTPKAFVLEHHYSGTYPAARRRFGLYAVKTGTLCGVSVFSTPMQRRVLDVLPGERGCYDDRAELGRFVLLDWVPGNAESWMLARCFELVRRDGWTGIVSHADPVPRPTATGEIIFGGHVGNVYQALNATFNGRTTPKLLPLFADGLSMSGRAMTKIRKRERGWRYASNQLVQYGAEPLLEDEDSKAWLRRWLAALTRPLRHEGNLRYLWALNPRDRKHLPKPQPYPKVIGLPLV
jgi:hypothetical protein